MLQSPLLALVVVVIGLAVVFTLIALGLARSNGRRTSGSGASSYDASGGAIFGSSIGSGSGSDCSPGDGGGGGSCDGGGGGS